MLATYIGVLFSWRETARVATRDNGELWTCGLCFLPIVRVTVGVARIQRSDVIIWRDSVSKYMFSLVVLCENKRRGIEWS